MKRIPLSTITLAFLSVLVFSAQSPAGQAAFPGGKQAHELAGRPRPLGDPRMLRQPLFVDAAEYMAGEYPTAVAVADFNGDGELDLVVVNSDCPSLECVSGPGQGSVSILLGKNDGTFAPEVEYPVGSHPTAVVVGDFNGDGIPDLAVTNYGGGKVDTVSVLLGKGDGTFAPHVDYSTGLGPYDLATADFNGDGKLDLVVTNYGDLGGGSSFSILLGEGDGTFLPHQDYPTEGGPFAVAVADFNKDGRADLAITTYLNQSVQLFLGNGDGTFREGQSYLSLPGSIAVGDFNGDGNIDIVNAIDGVNYVTVLLGNGDGTFQPAISYPAAGSPGALAVGDFNGDGKLDIAAANSNESSVSILLGNGDGTFQPAEKLFGTGYVPNGIAVGDFSARGVDDLVTSNWYSNNVSVLLGNGDGGFQARKDFNTGLYDTSVAVSDLNGDGKLDLVNATSGGSGISVLLGNGDGTFQAAVNYPAGYPVQIAVADLNGDGKPDLAVAEYNSDGEGDCVGAVVVMLGKGDGTFKKPIHYGPVQGCISSVAVGDFNRDGRLDLVVTVDTGTLGRVAVLLGNGDGTFGVPMEYEVGENPGMVVVGDFNRDGKDDLAVSNFLSNAVSVLLGNGDGTFRRQVTYATGNGPGSIAAGDLNSDGKLDLVTANSNGTVTVLLGKGDGTFQTQMEGAALEPSISSIAIADLNGDGKPDLVTASSPKSVISVLLGNGDGTFRPYAAYPVGTEPLQLAVGDFNRDGSEDLVTANWGGTVSILLNTAINQRKGDSAGSGH